MQPKRILVTRFSAMGDVAMVVPVLRALVQQNPSVEIVFASQWFGEAFVGEIPQTTLFRVDLKGRHRGIGGMWRLAQELKKQGPWHGMADLHNVLRTKLLRFFLLFSIRPMAIIDKGRREKHRLTRRKNKEKRQLQHTIIRYVHVFKRLNIELNIQEKLPNRQLHNEELSISNIPQKQGFWLGFAPFAKHKGKQYPLEYSERIVKALTERDGVKVFLFGGGSAEIKVLKEWEMRYPNVTSLAGTMELAGELQVMSQMDTMLTMDSANLHMASNLGVPTISIWGATHPFAGFYGWGQTAESILQYEDLECRPCSIFGNKPCFRKDYACLHGIPVDYVIKTIVRIIETHHKKNTTQPH